MTWLKTFTLVFVISSTSPDFCAAQTSQILAEGPRDVLVYPLDLSGNRKPVVKSILFRLTAEELISITYTPNGMETDALKANLGRVEAVELPELKKRWNWNSRTKKFEGDALNPIDPVLDTSSRPFDAKQEIRFLYYNVVRLKEVLDLHIQQDKATLSEDVLALARELELRAGAVGSGDLSEQFGSMKEHYRNLQFLIAKRQTVRELCERELRDKNAQKANEIKTLTDKRADAYTGMFVGSILDDYRKRKTRDIPLLFSECADLMRESYLQEVQVNEQYRLMAKEIEKRKQDDLESVEQEFEKACSDQQRSIVDFAAKEFGLKSNEGDLYDFRKLAREMANQHDVPYMLAALQRWSDFEKGNSERENPFRALQMLDCKMALYVQGLQEKSVQRFSLIREAVTNVKNVPDHKAYDPIRVYLLLEATRLANRVAMIDSRVESKLEKPHRHSLRQTYHPAALVALNLIAQLKKYTSYDLKRLVTEQEIYALAQSGQLPAALKLIREQGSQQSQNPSYQLFAARVIATNVENRPARDILEEILPRLTIAKQDGKLLRFASLKEDPDLKTYANQKSVIQLLK